MIATALVVPSVRLRAVRWPIAGAAAASAALVAAMAHAGAAASTEPITLPALGLAALVLAALLIGLAARHDRRHTRDGMLAVAPNGDMSWLAAGDDEAQWIPIKPARWFCGHDEVWIDAQAPGGRIMRLRAARADIADSVWRGLRRWLVWIERGPETDRRPA